MRTRTQIMENTPGPVAVRAYDKLPAEMRGRTLTRADFEEAIRNGYITAEEETYIRIGYPSLIAGNEIRILRSKAGMTQAAFSEAYNIPLRTLQSWESGERVPAEYIVKMLERLTALDGSQAKSIRLEEEGQYWTLYVGGISCGCGFLEDMLDVISDFGSYEDALEYAKEFIE